MLASMAAIIGIVVIGFPLLMYLMQDRLLFHPQPLSDAQRAEISRRYPPVNEISIKSEDGTRLHAWHVPGAPGRPLVIYFGGNAEEVSWMIEDARSRVPGVGWLLVSYRGYGGSAGTPSEAAISSDALFWHDHASTNLGAKEIVVFGRSLGSGAAVHIASKRPVKSVILVTPFDSLVAVAGHYYPYLPVSLMLKHKFDSAALAPAIKAPLLCIAAAQDEVIPVIHARKLYDAWGGEKRWIELKGAGHNSTDGVPAFWQGIADFLQK